MGLPSGLGVPSTVCAPLHPPVNTGSPCRFHASSAPRAGGTYSLGLGFLICNMEADTSATSEVPSALEADGTTHSGARSLSSFFGGRQGEGVSDVHSSLSRGLSVWRGQA